MEYEDFVLGVQRRASLDSVEDARVVCHATLVTLGEHLSEREKEYLAFQLPASVKECLVDGIAPDNTRGYSAENFYRRVGTRAGLHLREASRRSRAVVATLDEALGNGETHEARALLADKLETLLHD